MSGFIPPEVNSKTTTSWLALTAPYPSVSGCATAFFRFPGQPVVAWDPGYNYFASGTPTACLPPEVTRVHEQDHERLASTTVLSIQPIACPAAHTTAATEIVSSSSTMVMCCPSNYPLQNAILGKVTGECRSSLKSGQKLTYSGMDAKSSTYSSVTTITSDSDILGIGIYGWKVARATTTTSSFTLTPTAGPTTTPTPTAEPIHASSGLSTGAKAGIGAGVGAGVLGLLALIAALFLLRRRKKSVPLDPYAAAPMAPMAPMTYQHVQEQYIPESPGKQEQVLPAELPPNTRPVDAPAELPTEHDRSPVELPTSRRI